MSILTSLMKHFSPSVQPVQPKDTESSWRVHDQPFNGQWFIFPASGGRILVTVEGDREVAEHIVDLHNRSLSIL